MVYLRSEEHLARWLGDNSWEPGATLTASQMNDVARAWTWSRLDPGWRPRPVEEPQAILEAGGLTGDLLGALSSYVRSAGAIPRQIASSSSSA